MWTNGTDGDSFQVGNMDLFWSISASLVSVLGITCNSLLICVIIKSRAHQTPTNLFIGSLAIAEIVIATFGIPYAAASVMKDEKPYSNSMCVASACLLMLGHTSSVGSLMGVCIDRCLAVSRPLKYTHIITLKSASVAVLLIWLESLILSTLPLGSWGHYKFLKPFYICLLVRDAGQHQHVTKEILCSYIPAFVIIVTMLQIIREVRSHHRIFSVIPFPLATATGDIIPGVFAGARGFNRNTLKAMRSLFVVTSGYALFRLPVSVINIVYQNKPARTSAKLVTSLVWLSFLCCVINPIIIILFNRKFRAQIRALYQLHSCCKSFRASKDLFTVSSGLHTILDATLVLNMVKNDSASTTTSTRRQLFGITRAQ